MVSEQTIEEFRKVVKAEYGVSLTLKEAREILLTTVAYFDLLAKIYHRTKTQQS